MLASSIGNVYTASPTHAADHQHDDVQPVDLRLSMGQIMSDLLEDLGANVDCLYSLYVQQKPTLRPY